MAKDKDAEKWIEKIAEDHDEFKKAPQELLTEDFCLAVVRQDYKAMRFVPKKFKDIIKKIHEADILQNTSDFITPYLDKQKERAQKHRQGIYKDSPNVGIFWISNNKHGKKKDAWFFVYVLKMPIELTDKEDEVYSIKADHFFIWESLEPHGITKDFEYNEVPRGRVIKDKDGYIVFLGNYGFEDKLYTKVKLDLKEKISKEFNLPENSLWLHNLHYDIKKTKKKEWSKELQEQTYTEITNMITMTTPEGELQWVLGSFCAPYARLKHINKKFGKMSVENAHKNYHAPLQERNYIIQCEDGSIEEFKTVDELIDNGWVLD